MCIYAHIMLVSLATLSLLLFTMLAMFDGIGIHLIKLRLPERPQSWREHVWHTVSAVLFVPIVITIFWFPSAGITLWAGIALSLLMYGVEIFDVVSERTSRADLGGVSRTELALHVAAVATRSLALACTLCSRPTDFWSLASVSAGLTYPAWVSASVTGITIGSAMAAAAHVYLAWRHRPRQPHGAAA
jgi:hypothetical protein